MKQYHDLLRHILDHGTRKGDRTGTGTLSCFGHQMRFDLQEGFPLVTTKKLHTKSIIHELLWFLAGDTNIKYLQENGVDLGRMGRCQRRPGAGVRLPMAQLARRTDGRSTGRQRGGQIGAEPGQPPPHRDRLEPRRRGSHGAAARHTMFQFYVMMAKPSCQLYQRSADTFLGVPFNIASYALLTLMMAQVCDLEPGEFVHTFGDVHLYQDHLEQAACS